MKIGYARVSTDEQNLDLQITALRQAGCREIFTDQGVSGVKSSRPGLDALLRQLQPGKTLMVWRLDRLGRSLKGLVDLIDALGQRDIHFVSLTEHIDTDSPGGRLLFHMMAALAEFERSLISERTRAGMAAARARGLPVGRRYSLTDEQRAEAMRALRANCPLDDLARHYSVHPRTLRRLMSAAPPRPLR